MACELLGGALTAGGIDSFENKTKRRVLNGMLTIMLDPRRLGTAAAFEKEARDYLAWLRSSRPAPGFDRVRLAGEPEREYRAQREREGIPVDHETWNEIRAAAAKLKLTPEKIDALARG